MAYRPNTSEIMLDELESEFMRVLWASEIARRMSANNPLRGACGSDNKAYSAIQELNLVTDKILNPGIKSEEVAQIELVDLVRLKDSFDRRILNQGNEYADEDMGDDEYLSMTADADAELLVKAFSRNKFPSSNAPTEDDAEDFEDEEDESFYEEEEDEEEDEPSQDTVDEEVNKEKV